jgi:serine/threonine protein kinase
MATQTRVNPRFQSSLAVWFLEWVFSTSVSVVVDINVFFNFTQAREKERGLMWQNWSLVRPIQDSFGGLRVDLVTLRNGELAVAKWLPPFDQVDSKQWSTTEWVRAGCCLKQENAVLDAVAKVDPNGEYFVRRIACGLGPDGSLFVILKYMPNGDMFHVVSGDGARPEVLVPVCRALGLLHASGFVHMDCSLENMLVGPDQQLILTDFGLVCSAEQRPLPGHGKEGYMAPEILSPELQTEGYDPAKADVFSLGVCLFLMLYKFKPFGDEYKNLRTNQLYQYFQEHGVDGVVKWYRLTEHPEYTKLLNRMLALDWSARPTLDQIENELKHHTLYSSSDKKLWFFCAFVSACRLNTMWSPALGTKDRNICPNAKLDSSDVHTETRLNWRRLLATRPTTPSPSVCPTARRSNSSNVSSRMLLSMYSTHIPP